MSRDKQTYSVIFIENGKLVIEQLYGREAVTGALRAHVAEKDDNDETPEMLIIAGGEVVDFKINRAPTVELDLPAPVKRTRRSRSEIEAAGEPAPVKRRGRPRKDTNGTNGEVING